MILMDLILFAEHLQSPIRPSKDNSEQKCTLILKEKVYRKPAYFGPCNYTVVRLEAILWTIQFITSFTYVPSLKLVSLFLFILV